MDVASLVPYAKLVVDRVAGPDGVIATIAACRKQGVSRPEEIKPGMLIDTKLGKVQLSEDVAKLAMAKSTQKDVWRFLEPLTSGAEAVTLTQDDGVSQRVGREDIDYYRPIDDQQDTQETVERVTLVVANPNLEGTNRWYLRDVRSNKAIRCEMQDPQFISAVNEGMHFARGFLIDVRMRTKSATGNGSATPTRRILQVYSLRDPHRLDSPLYLNPGDENPPRLI